jgi:hypothetical protein
MGGIPGRMTDLTIADARRDILFKGIYHHRREISMITAAILFLIAAIAGAIMTSMRLQGRTLPPLALALFHGITAATALVVLIFATTGPMVPTMGIAAFLTFAIATIGGLILLLGYHINQKALPIPLILVHSSVAIIGFVLLVMAIVRSP